MAKKLSKSKAREILHHKEVHNRPLTDKQRRFFGAVASGYIKAQNGIEGTMGGLTDQGFDYNGAWGGPSMKGGGWLDKYEENVPIAEDGKKKKKKKYAWEDNLLNRPNYSTDREMIAIPMQRAADAAEIKKKAKNAAKETSIGPSKKSTPQSEQMRAIKNRTYAVQNAPYVQMDEQGNLSRAIPNVSMTGTPDPRTPEERWQKGIKHLDNAMIVAGGVEGLGYLGNVARSAIAKSISKSIESGLLSNTYKINPWAFKPNPEASYRMLGTEGYADALKSGVIRSKPGGFYDQPYFSKGEILDTYGGPYMAEIQGHPMVKNNMAFYSPHSDVVIPKRQIILENPGLKFYKQDWLRGYKEIPKPISTSTQTIVRGPIPNPYSGTTISGSVSPNVVGAEIAENLRPTLIDVEGNPINIEDAFVKKVLPRVASAEELELSKRLKGRNKRVVEALKNKKSPPSKKKNGGWLDKYQDGGGIQPPMAGANQTVPMYQMGGNVLPGAVGFTYARTNSPAPSEGKYAKKTMPSAENGMSFYQHGLDWTPRNISQDGSEINKAQVGGIIPVLPILPNFANIVNNLIGTSAPASKVSTPKSPKPSSSKVGVGKKRSIADSIGYNNAEISKFEKLHRNALYDFDRQVSKNNKYYNRLLDKDESKKLNEDTINLSSGRFKGAKVPKYVIDDIIESAKRNNYPVGKLLSLVGRESTFGVGNFDNLLRSGDKRKLVSGWNVAEDYTPYDFKRFLADKKVPGIVVNKNFHGYGYIIPNKKSRNELENYLKLHPELLTQYEKKLKSTKTLGSKNAYDLAIERLNKFGIKQYNPGDKNYESMYNSDYQLLQSDVALQQYLKSKGIKFDEGGVIKDDMGQWAHPGKVTEIGSNQITMQGVPYPVLGVSDEGDAKMMHPGKDYKFKGKKVTEYPVTNWLDKYK